MNVLRAIFAQRILMQSAPTPGEPCIVGADLDQPTLVPRYVQANPIWQAYIARDSRAMHIHRRAMVFGGYCMGLNVLARMCPITGCAFSIHVLNALLTLGLP